MTIDAGDEEIDDKSRSCANCTFAHEIDTIKPGGEITLGEKQLVCMRRPPSAVVISQASPLGLQHGIVSQFPPVTADLFCYDFDTRVILPQGEGDPASNDTDIVTGEKLN